MRPLYWVGTILLTAGTLPCCNCDDNLAHLNAAIQVDPTSLDFGKAPLGTTKQATLTLRNVGSFQLTASDFTAAAPFGPPLVGTATIAVAKTQEVTVTFSPTTLGVQSGVLTFATDDSETPSVQVPLSGEGIEAAVRLEPMVVDFGEILLIATLEAIPRQVTVTNPGSDNFDLTNLELSNDDGGAFTLEPDNAIRTYAPQDSDTFTVSFLPTRLGDFNGSVQVNTTAPDGEELTVSLVGKAVGPVMEICASTGTTARCTENAETPQIDFLADLNSAENGAIRVINTGDRDLHAEAGLSFSETEVTVSPYPSTLGAFVVQPGGEQRFDVQYLPQDYDFDVEIMFLVSDAANRNTASVRVRGETRRAIIDVRPMEIHINQDGPLDPQRVTIAIYDCGQYPLTLSSNVVLQETGGPAAGALYLENAPTGGATVQPQDCTVDPATLSFALVFDPPMNGSYSADVIIESNDPLTPITTVEVTAGRH